MVMQSIMATYGPVVSAINIDRSTFKQAKYTGVYSSTNCSSDPNVYDHVFVSCKIELSMMENRM